MNKTYTYPIKLKNEDVNQEPYFLIIEYARSDTPIKL